MDIICTYRSTPLYRILVLSITCFCNLIVLILQPDFQCFVPRTSFSWFLRTHGRVLDNNKKTSVAGYFNELLICILLFIFHFFICILLTQDYFGLKAEIKRHALLGFTSKKLNKSRRLCYKETFLIQGTIWDFTPISPHYLGECKREKHTHTLSPT